METQEVVCLKKGQAVVYESNNKPSYVREESLNPTEFCLEPLQVAIARLADEDIRYLHDAELIELARLSGLFSKRERTSYLQYLEHDELVQTAYLARRLCRQVVNAIYQRQGTPLPFPDDLLSPVRRSPFLNDL